jgi:hypothetical protein
MCQDSHTAHYSKLFQNSSHPQGFTDLPELFLASFNTQCKLLITHDSKVHAFAASWLDDIILASAISLQLKFGNTYRRHST